MTSEKKLQQWMKLRNLSRDALAKELAITDAHIATDRSFERLAPVTQWHNPDAHPGYFIFQGDALVMIYIDDEAALADLDPAEVAADLGTPDASLRSRAGKRVPLHVYAQQGVAYAGDAKAVRYLQIFTPMTLDEYQQKIYQEPPPYRK
ncbi:hypothetical protein [Haliangium sp.]|uniref:hypothetical protein n=1 Tax=Haliangium sp. TaxID=2663208 RepID=UPI003D0C1360